MTTAVTKYLIAVLLVRALNGATTRSVRRGGGGGAGVDESNVEIIV